MSGPSFSAVDESERERVFATLVLAFAADPVERWLYPETWQYLSQFPRFLAAFGGPAFAERTVWRLGEFSAVALWLPPGAEADGHAITALIAYLETPNPRTIAFYQRHGFEVTGEAQAGACPPITFMLRAPR